MKCVCSINLQTKTPCAFVSHDSLVIRILKCVCIRYLSYFVIDRNKMHRMIITLLAFLSISIVPLVQCIEGKVVCYNSGKSFNRADMVKGANTACANWNEKYFSPGEVAVIWHPVGNSRLKIQAQNTSPWGWNLQYQHCFEITRRLMDECNTSGTSSKQGGFFTNGNSRWELVPGV